MVENPEAFETLLRLALARKGEIGRPEKAHGVARIIAQAIERESETILEVLGRGEIEK
jgi:hypothetical protein